MEVSCSLQSSIPCGLTNVQRDPEDNSRTKDRLDYWLWLAKLADKGKITAIFIADSYAGHNIYAGSADASYKGGSHIGKLDPLMCISAMAAVTKSVSFGITVSTSYVGMWTRMKRGMPDPNKSRSAVRFGSHHVLP